MTNPWIPGEECEPDCIQVSQTQTQAQVLAYIHSLRARIESLEALYCTCDDTPPAPPTPVEPPFDVYVSSVSIGENNVLILHMSDGSTHQVTLPIPEPEPVIPEVYQSDVVTVTIVAEENQA